jgi:hypothetical protein
MQLAETAENTPARWEGILADLAVKRQAARDHAEQLRAQKQELALEAALGGGDARKRLEKINGELAKLALEGDDWSAAITQAEQAKRQAECAEAEAAECDRREQIGAALKHYLAEVREIDVGFAMLAAHFAAAKQSLDMAEGLMTGTEGQPLQQLRSKWGATLAAAFAGLGKYIELGPASMHTQHRQPLAQFAASFTDRWTKPNQG